MGQKMDAGLRNGWSELGERVRWVGIGIGEVNVIVLPRGLFRRTWWLYEARW